MDWFLYDNGLRHERVKQFVKLSPENYNVAECLFHHQKYSVKIINMFVSHRIH